MATKIIECTCDNKYQDKRYGFGKRVANATLKKSGDKVVYRCTVCSKEKAE